MIYIEAKDLVIGYDKEIVSSGINFSIEKGDFLSILGENGVGKSTLIKTLLGLQKNISGSIEFVNGISGRDIGYLPQQSNIQRDFPASVYEIVLSGSISKIKGFFYSKKNKEKAIKNMNTMGIYEFRNKSYRKLSGGQQQRVLLSRALMATDKILLLDEPVASLDPKASLEFYEFVKDLNENGITIIMVSHDMSAATKYSNKILHIGKKQLFFGDKTNYLSSPAFKIFSEIGDLYE